MAYNKKYADWNKKIWFEIYAPSEVFNEVLLGETPAYSPKQVIKRKVDINLAFLTGNFLLQNVKGIFQIKDVKGHKAYTELISYQLYPAYVSRIVRRGTSKVEDSFVVTTKDGIKVRVKPLIITRYKAKRAQRKQLREKMKEYLIDKISKLTFYEVIDKLLKRELQKEIAPILNKIFPVSHVEIRKFEREEPIIQEEKILAK